LQPLKAISEPIRVEKLTPSTKIHPVRHWVASQEQDAGRRVLFGILVYTYIYRMKSNINRTEHEKIIYTRRFSTKN
jgi:hypothetical protein